MKKSKHITSEFGASLVEMGLLIALIAVLAIPAIKQTGKSIRCTLCDAATPAYSGSGVKNYCMTRTAAEFATWGINC